MNLYVRRPLSVCHPVCDPQRVSVLGVGEGLSEGEEVVARFCLIRYQTMIASTTETSFARQFSSVSLVHKIETNIERQFFEVCPFMPTQGYTLRTE